MCFRMKQPLHFDIHHYSVEECKRAMHDHELKRRAESILHLDAAHGPIGANMAWSTCMPERYAVRGGDYHMNVELQLK